MNKVWHVFIHYARKNFQVTQLFLRERSRKEGEKYFLGEKLWKEGNFFFLKRKITEERRQIFFKRKIMERGEGKHPPLILVDRETVLENLVLVNTYFNLIKIWVTPQ